MIKNIYKTYMLNNQQINVLNGISLKIDRQEIIVIIGKSGCGKTTLLRIISKLEEPTSGIVDYNKRVAFVFQEPRLMPWLTVEQNIAFSTNSTKNNHSHKKIQSLIKTVGLEGFESAYPNQLSGGMMQRVSIARALNYQPELILMDEPFSALDYFTRAQMQEELIRVYNQSECSILFVTHNIDEALLLGNRIIILEDGIIEKEYTIDINHIDRNMLDSYFIEIKKNIIKNLNMNHREYFV